MAVAGGDGQRGDRRRGWRDARGRIVEEHAVETTESREEGHGVERVMRALRVAVGERFASCNERQGAGEGCAHEKSRPCVGGLEATEELLVVRDHAGVHVWVFPVQLANPGHPVPVSVHFRVLKRE